MLSYQIIFDNFLFFIFQSKDPHRSTPLNTFDNDRRSFHQNEQRLRHEKEVFERKQYVQHQEEEKIKEQQRRLAEERERMRREFESKSFFLNFYCRNKFY